MLTLLPCPFCGGRAYVTSNRDWHRLFADHTEDCFFDAEEEMSMVPATDEQLKLCAEAWNQRVPT